LKTKIYGHRGSKADYPENTMLGFEKALSYGVDGIEIDVHLTKDDEVVVIHDNTLDRTTGGTGAVRNHTLAEIRALQPDPALRVPTLIELLTLLDGKPQELYIEFKTSECNESDTLFIEKQTVKIVRTFGSDRKIIYSSFHLPTVLRIKQLEPKADIAWQLPKLLLPKPTDYIQTLNLEALHVHKDVVLSNPKHFNEICGRLRVWTVNDPEEMVTLFRLGIGAIITDCPDVAIKCMDKHLKSLA